MRKIIDLLIVGSICILIGFILTFLAVTIIKDQQIYDLEVQNINQKHQYDSQISILNLEISDLNSQISDLNDQLETDKFYGLWDVLGEYPGFPNILIFNRDNSFYKLQVAEPDGSREFNDKYWFNDETLYYQQEGHEINECSYEFQGVGLYKYLDITWGGHDTVRYRMLN